MELSVLKIFLLETEKSLPTDNPAVEAIEEQVEKATGYFGGISEYIKNALPSIIIAVIILIIGIIISKIIVRITGKALSRSNVDNAAKHFLESLVRIILYVVVIIITLSFLKVPMSSIITILGAAGLAVSLALQNCLSNLCGGFIILFSKPFSSGDIIEIDGSVGTVRTIGILYTKILTFDSKTVFIPNGKVSEAKIINYTETPNRRIDLQFNISYESDYDRARAAILEVIAADKLILKDPAPVVRMSAHNESSVSIDALVWAKNADYFTARYNMLEAVRNSFAENNIIIPFGQVDVHIKEGK
ncbi:MAG: mechanosensitive ion channel [Ruminococcus sp.]|nr:mechanosensitive ion channel [Ruminococcus sp.]